MGSYAAYKAQEADTLRTRIVELQDAYRELLAEWIQAEGSVISEYSGSILTDYQALIDEAKERAGGLGVPWDNSLVPDHITEMIGWSTD